MEPVFPKNIFPLPQFRLNALKFMQACKDLKQILKTEQIPQEVFIYIRNKTQEDRSKQSTLSSEELDKIITQSSEEPTESPSQEEINTLKANILSQTFSSGMSGIYFEEQLESLIPLLPLRKRIQKENEIRAIEAKSQTQINISFGMYSIPLPDKCGDENFFLNYEHNLRQMLIDILNRIQKLAEENGGVLMNSEVLDLESNVVDGNISFKTPRNAELKFIFK